MDRPSEQVYRVGDVEVDQSRACLVRGGQEQHVRQKTFQVLLYLIENRHRVVAKDELFAAIWKDTAVTDDTLVRCVVEARRALGDDPSSPVSSKRFRRPDIGSSARLNNRTRLKRRNPSLSSHLYPVCGRRHAYGSQLLSYCWASWPSPVSWPFGARRGRR